jgi:nicotinamide-nucleotide amidase
VSVAIVAVGDELLAGAHPDLNSPEIARRLGQLGVDVARVCVVGDQEEELAALLLGLARDHAVVVVTGGLGPTLDDVTRHAAARAAETGLATSEEALESLRRWYAGRGVEMPTANRRQALLPEGARLLANPVGTAPGFQLALGGATVFALPGPPREMRVMLEREVVEWIGANGPAARSPERRMHFFGLSESLFAEGVGPLMDRDAEPRVGCSVADGVLTVVLRSRAPDPERARASLDAATARLRELFLPHLFSEDEPRLERVLARELVQRATTIATAESCTGGLVAALVTGVPGASAVFGEGFVTYSDRAKRERLGVSGALLERHGAVSREVAEAMAAGAAERTGAELAVAVTGIAGPDGGTPAKPVGLVCFATLLSREPRSTERRFPALGRDWVRTVSAQTALFLCLQRLRERPALGGARPD